MKKAIAFISSTECEDSIKLLFLFEGELGNKLKSMGYEVVDASVDAMAFADEVKEKGIDEVLLVAVKKRGRNPGFYLYKPQKIDADNYTLAKLATATLTGYLDVDALLEGLPAFAPELLDRITVLECEPPCGDWERAILEALGEAK